MMLSVFECFINIVMASSYMSRSCASPVCVAHISVVFGTSACINVVTCKQAASDTHVSMRDLGIYRIQ